MSKRITAKIGEYLKDGKTHGKYVDIGVLLSNANGEYILLNPTIDLAGVLMRQRILGQKTNKQVGDSVMCSIFDNEQQQGSQGNQQTAQGASAQNAPTGGQNAGGNFNDDIPF